MDRGADGTLCLNLTWTSRRYSRGNALSRVSDGGRLGRASRIPLQNIVSRRCAN